ncbi:2OG-Fe(II) oxygenase [Phormidium sp. FACHB-592]|uniref:2OG-Fe(II) oxygenase n=1 Tax=Stenomitos frigidus AS-A4 TaxID=2933935 RepID=A0ABV0KM24_9CYAN|nr:MULTISPECIES: 2OG-Fe(II) oxygenase [Cyanophyceae]MBD2037244.1 2OG-Fe(II) oxygenase [Leptolyngbya sp. FACHB-321]MBD2075038.1 2OG-Fe(II) oxygenase [Phormidium sp. FACHB-592]
MNSTLSMFRLDVDYLKALALEHREAYATASPFPHIVIDNFLPEALLEEVLKEFPNPKQIDWQTFQTPAEKKLASRHEQQMGDATRLLLYSLNSSTFITFLEILTGIDGILPDPHFEGGGLHQIERGGFLKMHVDFNHHKKLRLDRRLNFLLYLNQDWKEEYGGHLELWDTKMTQCQKKILPVFNRCVVFSTTDFSYHGHPEPLTCPDDRTRKSLALYYYTNGRPAEEVTGKPHTTIFQARTQDDFKLDESPLTVKAVLKKLVPPILIDVRDALRNK